MNWQLAELVREGARLALASRAERLGLALDREDGFAIRADGRVAIP